MLIKTEKGFSNRFTFSRNFKVFFSQIQISEVNLIFSGEKKKNLFGKQNDPSRGLKS